MRDICQGKHQDNPQSELAFATVEPKIRDMQARILRFIYERRRYGATSKEISAELYLKYTTVSARLSELKAMNLIRAASDVRREGCAVMVGEQPLVIGTHS